nr:TIGR02300 family protein [Magnetospira sp. QH-2]
MAKPEWGIKRTCQSCGMKFYDMRKDPIVCPSCGATFELERATRPRRTPTPKASPKPDPKVKSFDDDEDVVVAEPLEEESIDDIETVEDTEDDMIEDTSDLGDDSGDMAEVIEHMDEDRGAKD